MASGEVTGDVRVKEENREGLWFCVYVCVCMYHWPCIGVCCYDVCLSVVMYLSIFGDACLF